MAAERTVMPSLRDWGVSGSMDSRPWLVHVVLSGLFRFKIR